MFKSKLQWEVTMWRHGVRIFWTSLSKWPSSSQRQCWCDFFTKRVKGGVKERQCCGSALVSMRIRIQHFRSTRIRIRIQGFHNLTVEKKSDFFPQIASLGITVWRTSKLQEKPPVLKGEHPALQNQYISSLFSLFLWVIFAYLDPDLAEQNQSESGPSTLRKGRLFLHPILQGGW